MNIYSVGFNFCFRLCILMLSILAVILIMMGNGVCWYRSMNRFCSDKPLSIDTWQSERSRKVKGQHFVVVIGLLCFVETSVLSAMLLCRRFFNMERNLAIICSILCLIAAMVETWYASGFGEGPLDTSPVIQSWAAAACLLYLCVILYGIDAFWCIMAKRSERTHCYVRGVIV